MRQAPTNQTMLEGWLKAQFNHFTVTSVTATLLDSTVNVTMVVDSVASPLEVRTAL